MLAWPFTVNEEVMLLAVGHPLLCQIITAVILDVLCLGRSAHMKTKGHAATFAGTTEDSDISLYKARRTTGKSLCTEHRTHSLRTVRMRC